jgi:SAM-dependent methyltransferase
MTFERLNAVVQRLSVSVEALAALGAELRLRRDGADGDPGVRALLRTAVGEIEPDLLDGLDGGEEAIVHAIVETTFLQAADLLAHPARPPGWTYDDPRLLEAQGAASPLVVRAIAALADVRPLLAMTLRGPGAFLDIGTGVGWLAIAAARTWPELRVVAIDIWEPALNLARRNVAESGLHDRIELRKEAAEQLADRDAFTLVWLPTPFISAEVASAALPRIYDGLTREGWLIAGIYPPAPTPLAAALGRLRTIRSGGQAWTAGEVEALLRSAGFTAVEAIPATGPIQFVLGRKSG